MRTALMVLAGAAAVLAGTVRADAAPRIAVLRFIPEGRGVPPAVVDKLTSAMLAGARRGAKRNIVTTLDALTSMEFNPMAAVAHCKDEPLCLAQIGTTLEVEAMVIGRVRKERAGVASYAIVAYTLIVARSFIQRRLTLALSGSADEVEREFSTYVGELFDLDGALGGATAGSDGAARPSAIEPKPTTAAASDPAPPSVSSPSAAPAPSKPLPPFRSPDAPVHDPPSDGSAWALVTGWSGVILGAAALGVAAWQGLAVLDAQEQYRSATTQVDAVDAKAHGEQAGLYANVAWSVGGGLAGIGAFLVVLDLMVDGNDAESSRADDGVRFAIAPYGAGADVAWRWSW